MSRSNDTQTGQMDALFTSGPVAKSYFHFALPVVTGMVISLIYNMADTWFIAKTGNTALIAGVSLGAPVFTLMIALGDIMGLGGSSVISRLLGRECTEEAGRVSAFSYYASLLLGILVSALLLALRAPILQLLGADSDTLQYASQYFTGIAAGAPFIILTFTPNNQLRTEGFARESMIGSILGTVLNIILDPVFILLFGWGASGAAFATVIGYVFTNLYYFYVLRTKCKVLCVSPGRATIPLRSIREILVIGIPASVTNLMQSFAITMTNRKLLAYGTDKIAAMGIVMKIHMLLALVLVGFAFGGQPLFGYLYGAKKKKRLTDVLTFSYGFELALSIGAGCVMALCARPLVSAFIQEKALQDCGVQMLRIQLSGIAFMSISLVSTCVFQSTGKALGAFVVSLSRQGVIFFLVLTLLSRVFGYYGVLFSQPVSDVLTAGIAAVFFYRTIYAELQKTK